MYHGPFPFAREAVPPAPSSRQSWKYFPTPVPVAITQEPAGRGAPLSRRIDRFLYTTPLAGPWGVSLGRHRVGGYRGNEIFFMRSFLHTLGSPYNANESFFMSAFFDVSGAARGLSQLDVPFPPVRGERPSPGFHRPLHARAWAFSECRGTPRVKPSQQSPIFFPMGGKAKRLSHFFHLKIGGVLRGRRATFPFPTERTRGRQSA